VSKQEGANWVIAETSVEAETALISITDLRFHRNLGELIGSAPMLDRPALSKHNN
jgi:hypothetical protein